MILHVSSDATHETILEAAWSLMKEDAPGATMASIARAAGVSRQAVYLHFESRAGLLLALVRWRDERSDFFARIDGAVRHEDAQAALGACVRTWLDYLPELYPVPAYLARARHDPAAFDAWIDRMRALERVYRQPIDRLHAEGRLVLGRRAAVDVVRATASLSAWEHLVVDRGWAQRTAVDAIWRAVRGAVLGP